MALTRLCFKKREGQEFAIAGPARIQIVKVRGFEVEVRIETEDSVAIVRCMPPKTRESLAQSGAQP